MKQNYQLLFLSCLSFLMAFSSFSQTITRGPYLQKGTSTSIVVKWRTSSNTESIVKYGTSLGSLNDTAQDLSGKSNHEIEITGLSSATKYFYSIHNSAGVLVPEDSNLFFKTHPNSGTSSPYRFWVLGDCGTADGNATAVKNAYDGYPGSPDTDGVFPETDGILFLGDNAYLHGTDSQFQAAVFDMYPDILKNTISWSCFGNHEGWWKSTSGYPEDFTGSPYYDIYTFPTAGESGGMPSASEAYYSFNYGNIHFIVLDSFGTDRSVGGVMYDWAQSDIQNTTQQWIIAFWHHPPYSKGSHDSDNGGNNTSGSDVELIQMRENFLPMLEANGVDLVLAGHSHSYERSYFINGHYGLSGTFDSTKHIVGTNGSGDGNLIPYSKTLAGADAGKGAVYVVTGSAGKVSNLQGDAPHNAMYYSVKELGSSILEVDGNNLTLKFLRETGAVDDQFTITKNDYDYVHVDNGWSPSAPPSSGSYDIVVRSGNPSISSNSSWNSVTVSPGSGLTISSGTTLTTTSGIDLNSTSRTYSSLILDGSISGGTINYNRFVNKMGSGTTGGNDMISAPLSGQTFLDFAASNPNLASNPANSNEKAFAPYNNSTSLYENYHTNTSPGNSAVLSDGKGYRAASTDGNPLKFTGSVSNVDIDVPVSVGSSNWNLIGNPFPSYIKAKDFLSNVTNAGLLDENNVGIYGYDADPSGTGGIWTIINLASIGLTAGPNIAPGQGFFVKAQSGGVLKFTTSMRDISTSDDFIAGRSVNTSSVFAKIKLSKGLQEFQTDIYFTEGTTRGLDPGYDAGAFQDNASGIFTHLVNDNTGIEMAIQALPYEDFNNVIVPLGIKADAGEQISIGIDDSSTVPGNINVYLEDSVANTLNLLNNADYTLTLTDTLNNTGRFFIHFTSSTLSLEDKEINNLQIYTSAYPKSLFVNGFLTERTIADIYDLQGRSVFNRTLDITSYSNEIDISTIIPGYYVVKVQMGELTRVQKVIIR